MDPWQPRSGVRQLAGAAAIAALLVGGCGASNPGGESSPGASPTGSTSTSAASDRAVVLVSGLATQTPFTTNGAACTTGLAAGPSVTALRESLIAAGYTVFSAPAQAGPGQVTSTAGLGASSDCPPPLPADVTIDTTADIDAGGERLAAFLGYLRDEYGVTSVDLVGHSMGGLFSRAAIGEVRGTGNDGAGVGDVTVTSLTTLSTPWTGTYPADYAEGALPLSVCGDEPTCLQVLPDYKTKLADVEGPDGAANVIGTADLQGTDGWNVAQGDDLVDIPVTLIGGDRLSVPGGDPAVWPNDGIVSESSAMARGISGAALPVRACLVRPDLHTIDLAEGAGLPWTASVTWDPDVMSAVVDAVRAARAGDRDGDRADC